MVDAPTRRMLRSRSQTFRVLVTHRPGGLVCDQQSSGMTVQNNNVSEETMKTGRLNKVRGLTRWPIETSVIDQSLRSGSTDVSPVRAPATARFFFAYLFTRQSLSGKNSAIKSS